MAFVRIQEGRELLNKPTVYTPYSNNVLLSIINAQTFHDTLQPRSVTRDQNS